MPNNYTGTITLATVEDGSSGSSAPFITLSGPTNVIAVDVNNGNAVTPSSSFNITATTSSNFGTITWEYRVNGSSAATSRPSYVTQSTDSVVTINPATFTANTLAITARGNNVSDTYTITKISNGADGQPGSPGEPGAAAIEVILSNEAHTLTATSAGVAVIDANAYTNVYVYEGTTNVTSSYTLKIGNTSTHNASVTINGITVQIDQTNKKVTVTAITDNFTSNVVPITMEKDTTSITKQFTISVSKAGADGDLYRVESSDDFIYAVLDQSTSTLEYPEVEFSPTTISFKVYKGQSIAAPGSSSGLISGITQDSSGNLHLDDGDDFLLTPGEVNETGVDYYYGFNYLGPDVVVNGLEGFASQGHPIAYIDPLKPNEVQFDITAVGQATQLAEEVYANCQSGNAFFVFVVYGSSNKTQNDVLTKYVFYVQNLLSTELLSLVSFKQTAVDIQASVDKAGIVFNSTGLSIYNGNLTIYDTEQSYVENHPTEDHRVLYFYKGVNDDPFLWIKGNGEFSGELKAASGTFTGELKAATGSFEGSIIAGSGRIGGFYITEDALYSSEVSVETGTNNIKLNGATGAMYARDITLGSAATIEEYIQLGTTNTAYLYNPDYALGQDGIPYFFKVNNNVYLTSTGELHLGRIILDGENSTIKGSLQDPDLGWPDFEITPEKAYFRNVDISGKISSSVFEVGHTQAVGGSMLFKPAYKVISYTRSNNSMTLILDGSVQFSTSTGTASYLTANNEYILILNTEGQVIRDATQVTSVSVSNPNSDQATTTITISGSTNDNAAPASIIILGVNNALIIGVNSTDTSSTYLRPRGITISEFKANQSTLPEPKVYIGDLKESGLGVTGVANNQLGYGLFSNNVILRGSLTTQSPTMVQANNATYAGINTLTNVVATKFGTYAPGEEKYIVFWAGAENAGDSIAAAPFQVTTDGSLYANQGLFEGAIITEAEIRGADIYAARIHGSHSPGSTVETNYGLAFYNTTNGIVFKRGGDNDATATTVFSISENNFKTQQYSFITIDNNGYVEFTGKKFIGEELKVDTLSTTQLKSKNGNEIITIGSPTLTDADTITYTNGTMINTIYLNYSNNIAIQKDSNLTSNPQMIIGDKAVQFDVDSTVVGGVFELKHKHEGTNVSSHMRYNYVTEGYDLYIEYGE